MECLHHSWDLAEKREGGREGGKEGERGRQGGREKEGGREGGHTHTIYVSTVTEVSQQHGLHFHDEVRVQRSSSCRLWRELPVNKVVGWVCDQDSWSLHTRGESLKGTATAVEWPPTPSCWDPQESVWVWLHLW